MADLYQQWKARHGDLGERALREKLPFTDPFVPVLQKEGAGDLYQQWKAKQGTDTASAETEGTKVPPTKRGTLRGWEKGLFRTVKDEAEEWAVNAAKDAEQIIESLPQIGKLALAAVTKEWTINPFKSYKELEAWADEHDVDVPTNLWPYLVVLGKEEAGEYKKLGKHPYREAKKHPLHTALRLLPIKYGAGLGLRAVGSKVSQAVSKYPALQKALMRQFSYDPKLQELFRRQRGGVALGELDAKQAAASLYGFSAGERLRAGQMIKGSISTAEEVGPLRTVVEGVKKTRDWLEEGLKERGLLGEETFLTKLPKKKVAQLNETKATLETRLDALRTIRDTDMPSKSKLLTEYRKLLRTKEKYKGRKRELKSMERWKDVDLDMNMTELALEGLDDEIARVSKMLKGKGKYKGLTDDIAKLEKRLEGVDTRLYHHYHYGGWMEYMPREYLKHLENKQTILHQLNPKKYGIKTPWEKGRKDIPDEIRLAMGEVLDPTHPMYLGISRESRAIATYDLFQEIAKNPKWVWDPTKAAGQVPEGFVQISKTDKLKTLGDLSGKYVRKDIAEVINRFGMTDTKAIALYKKAMGVWKMGKILPRPGTHMRNMYNNVVFLDFAGLSPFDPMTYVWLFRAAKEIKNKGPILREILKTGRIETEFYGQEMLPLIEKYLNMGKKNNLFDDVSDMVKAGVNKAGELYKTEDQMFKVAIYMKNRAAGKVQEGLELVDRFMPNYAEVPGVTRIARQTAIPFASFKSEAFRIFNNAAQDHPLKLAYWMSLPGLITDMSAKSMGLSDKQVDKLEREMPEYAKNGLYALVPSDPKHPKWWDMSYIFFWNDLVETSEGKGLLAHPLLGIGYALQGQIQKGEAEEVFTHKTITTPGRSMRLSEKLTNWAKFVWGTATPATPTPGAPDYAKIKRAVTKERHPWTGETPSGWLTALDVVGGVRVKGFGTPEQMEESRMLGQASEASAIKKRIRRLRGQIERGFLTKEKERENEETIEWLEKQLDVLGEEMDE